ncbi:hypothetical protein H0H92_000144 [Tricholoma furcatifolium]|nr:hypothetical protein H0H92_000144 [Tricholoma furcatifolium]
MNVLPLTPMLYEDPAFSSDPHAHPFFHTTWSFKPDDDPRLLQGPMLSDDHSSNTHESNSSSNHTSTTPPTSTEDLPSQWSSQKPWPPEIHKKKKSLSMFWRKSPPETVLALAEHPRNVSPEPPFPPRSKTPALQPTTARMATASLEVPARRPAPASSKLPPIAARRIAGVAIRGSELDRIDELDESHPSGLPLHHMGPYEAAKKQLHRRNLSEGTSVPIVPAGVSLNLSPGQLLPSHFYHQLNQNLIPPTAPLHVPARPSLVQTHVQHQQQGIHHHQPQPQPQPQPHRVQNQTYPRPQPTRTSDTSHQITRPILAQERPQEIPSIAYNSLHTRLDNSQGSSPNAPPEYSPLPNDPYTFQGDSKQLLWQVSQNLSLYGKDKKLGHDYDPRQSHQFFVNEPQLYPEPPIVNIQPDFRVATSGPRLHQQNNPRLPPRMQALQMQIPRTDEKHRRSPRPPNTLSLDYQNSVPLNVQGQNHLVQRRWSHIPTTMIDNTHQIPLFVDNNGFPTSPPAPLPLNIPKVIRVPNPPSNISQLPPGPANPVSSQSVHSGSNSIHPGHLRTGPPPSHLPKHLVMPAPLQISQSLHPQHQLQAQTTSHYAESQSWQPHSRQPVPTTLQHSYIDNQLHPDDIQMLQSRKLRKRIGTQGIPLSAPVNPTELYLDDLPLPQPLSIRKTDKTQKNVLSKRRTDF